MKCDVIISKISTAARGHHRLTHFSPRLPAQAKMKKAAHERLEVTLAGVKQGAVSLWQRLQAYSFLLDASDCAQLQRMKERTDAEVERDTLRALSLCETLLSIMLEVSILALARIRPGILEVNAFRLR